jgi:hypothetical protein
VYGSFHLNDEFYALHPTPSSVTTAKSSPHHSAPIRVTALHTSLLHSAAASSPFFAPSRRMPEAAIARSHSLTRIKPPPELMSGSGDATYCGLAHPHVHSTFETVAQTAPATASASSAAQPLSTTSSSARASASRPTDSSSGFQTQATDVRVVEVLIVNDHQRYLQYRQQTEILSASTCSTFPSPVLNAC